MSRRLLAAGSIFVLIALVAACATETESEPEPKSLEGVAGEYLLALASGELDQKRIAREFTVPNSAADIHVVEQVARIESLRDDGVLDSLELDVVNASEETLLCFDGHDQPNVMAENFCFVYSNFVIEEGLVLSFDVRGEPLEGQVVLRYFSAIAEKRPELIRQASKFTVPDSAADTYLFALAAYQQAFLDGGSFDTTARDVLYENNEVSLCARGYKQADADRRDYCSDYYGFVFDGDRLVTFDSGGRALEGRVILGDGEVSDFGSGATFTRLVTYESELGAVIVVLEFTSKSSSFELPFRATYVGPDGRAMESGLYGAGPRDLKNGRTANAAYTFPGAQLGGTLELFAYGSFWDEMEVEIPTG